MRAPGPSGIGRAMHSLAHGVRRGCARRTPNLSLETPGSLESTRHCREELRDVPSHDRGSAAERRRRLGAHLSGRGHAGSPRLFGSSIPSVERSAKPGGNARKDGRGVRHRQTSWQAQSGVRRCCGSGPCALWISIVMHGTRPVGTAGRPGPGSRNRTETASRPPKPFGAASDSRTA